MGISKEKDGIKLKDIECEKAPLLCSYRAALAVVGFFGFINMYALRVDMSVAMVCMVNQTALGQQRTLVVGENTSYTVLDNQQQDLDTKCERQGSENGTNAIQRDGEFAWDKGIQGLVLGSFFWGYMVGQVPGGYLAARFGGKHVFGWCMLTCAVATLFMPLAARISYIFLIVLRIIAGVGQSVVWPAMHAMWAYWAPPLERSQLIGFTFAGSQIGNVVTFPLAGLLCEYGFDGGWPSVFYVLGGFGVLWFIAWMFIASDTPEKHPRISERERVYIQTSLQGAVKKSTGEKISVPWLSFARSLPVWAIVILHMCANWTTYTFLTNMPAYINEVLKFDIKSNGALSAIPYLCMWAMINISGNVADIMRRKGFHTTFVRKLFSGLGGFVPAILCIGLGFFDCTQSVYAIGLMTIAVSFIGCHYGAGVMVNHADIAPKYASLLFGISNTFATLPGFLAPYAIGKMTPNQTQEEWRNVFFLSAAITSVGTIFNMIFASGDLQEWAREDDLVEVQSNIDDDAIKGEKPYLQSAKGLLSNETTKL